MSPSEPTERFPRAALPERYRDPVVVGRGGMAEVHRAEDVVLGRTVAVKVLAGHLAGQEEFRRRFRREAVSAARIAHPHVATVYDVGEHQGRPYLVMEYLPGGALADRIAGRPSLAQALDWIEQVAAALDAAHAKGVVHRDIKPANLLLDATGHVKVADFGIAPGAGGRRLDGHRRRDRAGHDGLPGPGAGAGRAGDLRDRRLRARRGRLRAARLYEPVPRASARAEGIPHEVDGVLARGMAKEQEDRPPSAGALAADLRAAALGIVAAAASRDPGPDRAALTTAGATTAAESPSGGRPRTAGAAGDLAGARARVDRSTALLSEGDPAAALPLAVAALGALEGTGDVYEGNASYDAGRSPIDLGRCEEAVPLLERSLDIGTGTRDERRVRRDTLNEARRCD